MKLLKKGRRHKAKQKQSPGHGARKHHLDDISSQYRPDVPLRSIEMPPTPPADSPSPEQSPQQHRKRRRHPGDVGEEGHRRKRMTPENTPEWEIETEMVSEPTDRTFVYDPYDVEPPASNACLPWLERDAFGNYPPPTDRSKIDDTILKPLASDLVFPNVLDDRREMVMRTFVRPKKARAKRSRKRRSETPQEVTEDKELPQEKPSEDEHPVMKNPAIEMPPPQEPKQAPTPDPRDEPDLWKRQKQSPFFSILTEDIRQLIYREALVASTPIAVHSNWRKIYKRKKACLSIQLIMLCEATYHEALPILYGQNVFEYRIRDAVDTVATIGNIHHAALTAGHAGVVEDEDSEESGSDWERDCAPSLARRNKKTTKRVTRSSARQKKIMDDSDINVKKFAHLFRRILIEAESNRHEQVIQECMAQAIEFFRFRGEDDEDDEDEDGEVVSKRLNIHTLTIRVTPSRQRAAVHGYTFVDFFDKDSAVINAVKKVDCRFLRIELDRSMLDTSLDRVASRRGEGVTAIQIPFFHQRAAYNVHKFGEVDIWANDCVMQMKQQEKIQTGRARLDNLATEVQDFCKAADDGQSNDIADSAEPIISFEDDTDYWDEFNHFPDENEAVGDDEQDAESAADESQHGDNGKTAGQVLAQIVAASDTVAAQNDEADGNDVETDEGVHLDMENADDEIQSSTDAVTATDQSDGQPGPIGDQQNAEDTGDEIQVSTDSVIGTEPEDGQQGTESGAEADMA